MGEVNKHFVFKSLLTSHSNVLTYYFKLNFLPMILIFTVDDKIEFWLSS